MELKRIVLTGGPCAGKTTALSKISDFFSKTGWKVIVVNEAATELITAGLSPIEFREPLEFQKLLAGTQLNKEYGCTTYPAYLKDNEKVLVVCDRGICDNRAYLEETDFIKVLNYYDLDLTRAFDRYDAVFHLVTAADGAETFYNLDNNDARSESLEEAIELDRRTQNAWVGHPHLRIIKNEGSFEDKLRHLLSEIASFLGEPEPYEIERKYLIGYPDIELLKAMPNCDEVEILQTYLISDPNTELRVRQRGQNGSYSFTKTEKRNTDDPARRIEVEKRIDKDEYLKLLMHADPELHPIRKTRYLILQRESGQYLEIDVYPGFDKFAILEIELATIDTRVKFPPYLTIFEDVTYNPDYRNKNIARTGKPPCPFYLE